MVCHVRTGAKRWFVMSGQELRDGEPCEDRS